MEKYNENNLNVCYETACAQDEPEIKKLLDLLHGDESNFDINKFVVAKSGGRVIGCIRVKRFNDGCLELSSLGVLPEYQNKGIGSRLMNKMIEIEKQRPIYLLTSSNHESYYKKFGASIINSESLPEMLALEYSRIINLPFAKDIQVIVMAIN